MADDQTNGSVRSASLELSRPLARLLRRYATKVEALRNAESNYHDVMLTESLRHRGQMKRASSKRIDAAFDALVDAVVDLQGGQVEILLLAEGEGMLPETVGALNEAFESANRECAGYLAARTYDQVREAARRRPLIDRSS